MKVMTQIEAQEMVREMLEHESVEPEPQGGDDLQAEAQEPELESIDEVGTPEGFLDSIEEGMAKIRAAEEKLRKHAEAMYKMTDWNDHQGANLYLAQKVLKDKKLTEIGKGIQQIHSAIGSMPSQLIEFRERVYWPMLEAAMKSKFRPDEVNILMQGF